MKGPRAKETVDCTAQLEITSLLLVNQGLKTDRVFFAVIVPCHIIDETHCIFEI